MTVIIGDAAVMVALASSLMGIAVLIRGIRERSDVLLTLGIRLTGVVFFCALLAAFVMEWALLTDDFSVLYVAQTSATTLSNPFKFATLWGALEGSILLWSLVLGGYLALIAWKFREKRSDPLVAWALITMFAVCVFFFGLMTGVADPFKDTVIAAGSNIALDANGIPVEGLNGGPDPLLQNHLLMAFHPPMLYLGYVGFTVPFAFAIGALVTGRLGEGWLIETRRWTLFAWGFLTVGILLGAWWAYDVLGWGGYWGWDPVENASMLPWLTGTAFIHSVMVQERRGMLRVWNLSLVCATFSLTILGTFFTRSGVVDSVHAFTTSGIGPMLLGFFAVIVVVTVGLIGWRGDRLRSPGRIDSPISREGSFLANNLLFAVLAFILLLGMVFPLIVEATRGDRITVGVPYFERMTMPVGLLLLFLMAVAPVLPWRKASQELLRHRLMWPSWLGAAALVFSIVVGARGFFALVAFFLGGFAGGAALRQVVLATRRQGWRGFVGRTNGGMIVHIGVVMIAVALAASGSYEQRAEFAFDEGETIEFADRSFTFTGVERFTESGRNVINANVYVDGELETPGVRQYLVSGRQIGSPVTATSLSDNVQLSLNGQTLEPGAPVIIRITVQPLVQWLWIGGAVMAIGTILSAFPTKHARRGTEAVSAPTKQRVPAGAVAS